VSKNNQQEKVEDKVEDKVEEETTVPADTDTEKVDDDVTDEAAEKVDEPTEVADEESSEPAEAEEKPKSRVQWARVFAFGVLPAVALLLAMGAGYLKWMDNSVRNSEIARIESVQAAKDTTVKMLSYKPDSVEKDLNDARSLLTGDFRDSYTSLINDVVIPGAKQKQISAVASVPEHGAASVSADPNHAVVLVFVNQTVVVGQDPPTDTASSVRVTLDKVGDRWLISKFDPV
jgi:Mce-associated membrane protein